ncbi:hypothetical protein MTO96_022109 [Rhipicephalus appendiculatus]
MGAEGTRPVSGRARNGTPRAAANRFATPSQGQVAEGGILTSLWWSTVALLLLALAALVVTFYYLSTGVLRQVRSPSAQKSTLKPLSKVWIEETKMAPSHPESNTSSYTQ